MRNVASIAGFLLLSLVAVLLLVTGNEHLAAADRRVRNRIAEHDAGAIPSDWGDIVAVSGDFSKHTLTFRNQEGEIRIITLAGSNLPDRAVLIRREYRSGGKN